MRKPWIFALCLIAIVAAGLPLHAQQPAPPPGIAAAPAVAPLSFLTALAPAPAPPAALPWLQATCTVAQCRANCDCGGGCDSVCKNLSKCICGCMSTHVPPLPCQV